MKKLQLGSSDLWVTNLCMGTMTFGEQNTEAEGFAIMDAAFEAGINFFDTAEIYPVPVNKATFSRTENELTIVPQCPVGEGQTMSVRVDYSGQPQAAPAQPRAAVAQVPA